MIFLVTSPGILMSGDGIPVLTLAERWGHLDSLKGHLSEWLFLL